MHTKRGEDLGLPTHAHVTTEIGQRARDEIVDEC